MYIGKSSALNEGLDEKELFQNSYQQSMNLDSTLNHIDQSQSNTTFMLHEFGLVEEQTNFPINSSFNMPNTALSHLGNFYPQLMPMHLCTPQPTLFHLSSHGSYGLGSSGTSSLFSHGTAEEEVSGDHLYHDGSFGITADINYALQARDFKTIKHHDSEKQRRVQFTDKFQALRSLIPNPSKNDRATIIADAIGYINELKMTVNKLKNLVELKKARIKRYKRGDSSCDMDIGPHIKAEKNDQVNNEVPLRRSSWLQKKSNKTEVDVRIMDDEVTVKLVQQKGLFNCLLFVSKALDEFQIDLHHVAGGLIGDYYTYLFNSKICEGSTVYANAIANKVIEVLEKENVPTNNK